MLRGGNSLIQEAGSQQNDKEFFVKYKSTSGNLKRKCTKLCALSLFLPLLFSFLSFFAALRVLAWQEILTEINGRFANALDREGLYIVHRQK